MLHTLKEVDGMPKDFPYYHEGFKCYHFDTKMQKIYTEFEKSGMAIKFPRLFTNIITNYMFFSIKDKLTINTANHFLKKLIHYNNIIISQYTQNKSNVNCKPMQSYCNDEKSPDATELFYQQLVVQFIDRYIFLNDSVPRTIILNFNDMDRLIRNLPNQHKFYGVLDRYFCYVAAKCVELHDMWSVYQSKREIHIIMARIVNYGIIAFQSDDDICAKLTNNLDSIINAMMMVAFGAYEHFLYRRKYNYKSMSWQVMSDEFYQDTALSSTLTMAMQYYLWCKFDLNKLDLIVKIMLKRSKYNYFGQPNCDSLGDFTMCQDIMMVDFIKHDWQKFYQRYQKMKYLYNQMEIWDDLSAMNIRSSGMASVEYLARNFFKMKRENDRREMIRNKFKSTRAPNDPRNFEPVLSIDQSVQILKNMAAYKECNWMGCLKKDKKLRRCKRCKCVFYCSKRCQKLDWNSFFTMKCGRSITPHRYFCRKSSSTPRFLYRTRRRIGYIQFD